MGEQIHIPHRDGATYEHARDGARLAEQHQAVWDLVKDGRWRTPAAMEAAIPYNWASISARLRDFRKKRFGEHTVSRRSVGNGLFEYRLLVNRKNLFS